MTSVTDLIIIRCNRGNVNALLGSTHGTNAKESESICQITTEFANLDQPISADSSLGNPIPEQFKYGPCSVKMGFHASVKIYRPI